MNLDRRRFVGSVGVAALAGVSANACASFVVTPVTPVDGVIRLPIRNYPQLEQPGGSLRIQPAGQTGVLYVMMQEDGTFAVLSSICTHLQCTVNMQGQQLVCPCHGSTFDRAGRVLRGPAAEPLQRHASTVNDGVLIIRFQEAS